MKRTALLIDGGWFSKGLATILKLPGAWPAAIQVRANCLAVLDPSCEEVFRIFYYDCEPFGEVVFFQRIENLPALSALARARPH